MGGVKKYKLKRALAKIFRIQNWKLIIIALLLVFFDATLLRFDHVRMSNLKDAVIMADESGDTDEIIDSLNDLKSFTLRHIVVNEIEENGVNRIVFGTGPFYLENEYRRHATEAFQKAQNEITQNDPSSEGVYAEVTAYCDWLGYENGWGFYTAPYINCIMDGLNSHPSASERMVSAQADLPSTELFRYDFSSPKWYPCFSGIMILITILLVIVITVRILIWLGIRLALKIVK